MRQFLPYIKYLKPVRVPLIAGILCGILFGVSSGWGFPYMVGKVFPKIFAEGETRLTGMQILLVALQLPAVFLLRGLAGYFNAYLVQFAGVRVLEAIRLDYFRKIQALPLAFFHRISTGEVITRGLSDANQLQFTLTNLASDIVKQPASLISAIGYLCYLAYTTAGVSVVLISMAMIPLSVFPIRYVGKKMLHRAQEFQGQTGGMTDRFTENLAAVKEVRAFNLEKSEVDRFARLSELLVRAQMKVVKYQQALTPSIEIISAFGISLTFFYAYKTGINQATFISIIGALYLSYEPIKKLGVLNNDLTRGRVSLERLEEVLNEPLSIADPKNPVEISRLRGDIAFERATFWYKPGTPVLKELDVTIPQGTICALVGPSGAGKTTFANLVPRFFEVTEGAVKIDGVDVRRMRVADLRRNIAIVSQDPVLFNESIYHNILLGRPEATRDEVIAAAKDAFAHDFITTLLPQGYDTVVGERGSQLSGGQRQRIAIARAVLRNAPILILDEATSALDSESEAYIQKALNKLMSGKTVLIIAHRFSTIRDATKILVFNGGRIQAAGGHKDLYDGDQLYRSLYNQQQIRAAVST